MKFLHFLRLLHLQRTAQKRCSRCGHDSTDESSHSIRRMKTSERVLVLIAIERQTGVLRPQAVGWAYLSPRPLWPPGTRSSQLASRRRRANDDVDERRAQQDRNSRRTGDRVTPARRHAAKP